jgi:hypothetical protein
MIGNYAQYNLLTEPTWAQFIYEANVGFKISRKQNVWLDAGIMPSHIGFESAVSADCWTLTRSILAENSPYYETGVKISYTNQSVVCQFRKKKRRRQQFGRRNINFFVFFFETFSLNSFVKFKKRTNKSLLLNVAELKMLGTKKANNDTKSKNESGKRKVENGNILRKL